MKGVKVIFSADGCDIDFSKSVDGFHSTAQNCLVNIGTEAGTDVAYPDKGTDLLKKASSGYLSSESAVLHAVNGAAIDTLFFTRTNDYATEDLVDSVILEVKSVTLELLDMNAVVESVSGERVGQPLTI